MSLNISPLISSGMVIQQGLPIPVWGKAEPGAELAVTFLGKTYRARAGEYGAWRTLLDSQNPGGPYTLEICANADSLIIEDIYIGDVWLCSGQSNMEMPLERLKDDFPEEWTPGEFPPIRQFKVPQEWDFSGPRQDLAGGSWMPASKETLHEFSGTAWFFAQALFEKHQTPIGLVNAAWGGTPAEAWMSRDALAEFPAAIADGAKYADSALCAKIAAQNAAEIQAWEDYLIREDRGLAEKWQEPQTGMCGWNAISLPGDFSGIIINHEETRRKKKKTNQNSVFSVSSVVKFFGHPLRASEGIPSDFCGVIWLAREFTVSKDFAAQDAKIWLGTITDADAVFVNGV
jgi:sialate O-acetylesterase